MKKKGFTLVELLAVIVILAIIAVIAVPVILGVIENSKKGAFRDSAYGVIDAAELYLSNHQELMEQATKEEGIDISTINYKGAKYSGEFRINEAKQIEIIKITDNNYCGMGTKGNFIVKNKCSDLPSYILSKPTVTANDGILGIHSSPYKLIITSSDNDVDFYYGTDLNNMTKGEEISSGVGISEEGRQTYYIKACKKDNSTECSAEYIYVAELTNCNVTGSISGNNTDANNYSSSDVELTANTSECAGAAQFEWRKDGSIISGATNNKYTATESGQYSVKVTYSSGNYTYTTNVYIDKTTPTCNIEITGDKGLNDWYISSTVGVKVVGTTTGASELTIDLKKDGTSIASPYTLSSDTASMTFSGTVTNKAGISAICDNVTIKKDSSTPAAPTITSSDNITSGSWHTSNEAFNLTVSGSSSISEIDHYLLDDVNPPTTNRNSVSISGDTSNTTYYAKACNKAGTCGENGTYVVRRDTCNPTVTISGNDSSAPSSSVTLTANPSTCASSVTTYQWYKDGTAISGATNSTYTASDSGTYAVRVDYGSGKYATNTTVVYTSIDAADVGYENSGLGCTGTTGNTKCALDKLYDLLK